MAVCYRHKDRETGVSCSNCGNPICPDCMTATPVRVSLRRVRTALSDGQRTQIFSQNPKVKEGLKVIVGSSLASQGTEPAAQSPLTPQRRGRGF